MIGAKIGSRIQSKIGSRIGQPRGGVSFVSAVGATFAAPVDFVIVTVATPAETRSGDTMLFFVTTTDGALAAAPPTGFAQVAALSTASSVTGIYRRIATGSESASYSSQLTSGASHATGVLLVYRGLDGAAGIVGDGATELGGTTAFSCPSITLASATDLFIGMVSIFNDLTTFTPPVGATERIDEIQTSEEAQTLTVFDLQRGVAGATGAQTATADGIGISGVAVSLALKAA